MPAIDFPDSPIPGETFSVGNSTWQWTGLTWDIVPPINTAVLITGDQTINGIKTFVSSPIVPTPTSGTQVTNKSYVDTVFSTRYIRRHDYTGGFSYCASAATGSAESSAVWNITRITINANGTTGAVTRALNVAWSNRLSATYS